MFREKAEYWKQLLRFPEHYSIFNAEMELVSIYCFFLFSFFLSRKKPYEDTPNLCVCTLSLSEIARVSVRTSDNEAVRENGRNLQVQRCLVGWMIVVIPSELTSLIHSKNETALSVNPKCL